MLTVRLTQEFQTWLDALKDARAKARITARIRQAGAGNLGEWKAIAGPISEMKIDFGPGYRLYFTRRGNVLVIMLAGGDKSSQARDIRRAQRVLDELGLNHGN